jgi:hypothetical protein
MELVVIDKQRMKIMLSCEELSSYNIDASTFDPQDEETKRILYDIVDRARRSAGLEGASGGMFVQVFTSTDGGCEMYVTDFSRLGDEESGGEDGVKDEISTTVRKKRQVYRFAGVKELLLACRALSSRGYNGTSDAYITDGHETYLVLGEWERESWMALEFGESVFFGGMFPYLAEHTRPIKEGDAVNVLGELCPSTYS